PRIERVPPILRISPTWTREEPALEARPGPQENHRRHVRDLRDLRGADRQEAPGGPPRNDALYQVQGRSGAGRAHDGIASAGFPCGGLSHRWGHVLARSGMSWHVPAWGGETAA